MTIQKHRYALALMLLTVSALALVPTLTTADPQKQVGAIGIKATGQATPIGKGKGASSGPATLSLNGTAQTEGNEQLKLNGLTGFLLIGSANYTITGGQGEINNKGTTEINAKTSGGNDKNNKNELVLHGTIQGANVVFDSHESKLSSLYFLALTGQASIAMSSISSTSKKGEGQSGNTASTATQTVTLTGTSFVTQNITVTQKLTQTANTTLTQNVTQTVNNTLTKTEFQNQTITQTVTKPINFTVTVTQPLNQTITVTTTRTVANSTITETVTTTVANMTITTTVSNSTAGP